MCVCICVSICIYVYVYIYIYIHMYVYTYTCIHVCIYINMYVYITARPRRRCVAVRARRHWQVDTGIYTYSSRICGCVSWIYLS